MSYTKTIFCRQSGLQITIIDDLPDGNYSEFKSHPQLGNLHSIIEKYRTRANKAYLAAGILYDLRLSEALAFPDHYPSNTLATINQLLQQHSQEFLYSLYQKVHTFLYSGAYRQHATINLATLRNSPSKFAIVSAISSLLGEPDIPINEFQEQLQIDLAKSRIQRRLQLKLKDLEKEKESESKTLGNMNLDKIIERVILNSKRCAKRFPEKIELLESFSEITLSQANASLASYVFLSEETRIAMAKLYRSIHDSFKGIIKTETQKKSFDKIVSLLKDMKTKPIELGGDEVQDLSAFMDQF